MDLKKRIFRRNKKNKSTNKKNLLPTKRIYSVLIAIFLTGLLLYFCYILVLSIRLDFETWRHTEEKVSLEKEGQSTILLAGLDEQTNGYNFVDYLSVVHIDERKKIIKVFNIDPRFAPYFASEKEYISLNKTLAYGDASINRNGTDMLRSGVENIAALPVDAYILIKSDDFEKLFSYLGTMQIEAPMTVEDKDVQSDLIIREGVNNINAREIIGFLSAEEKGRNDRLLRQNSALESLMRFNIPNLLFNPRLDNFIRDAGSSIKTNINKKDLIRIVMQIYYTKPDIVLGSTDTQQVIPIEGTTEEKWYTIYETLDADLRKVFTNKDAQIEQARIDVLNSTLTPNLAGIRSRWLSNRGLRVVISGNHEQQYEKTTIYVSEPEKYPETLREIRETLIGEPEITSSFFEGRAVGDIVIVLGENEV